MVTLNAGGNKEIRFTLSLLDQIKTWQVGVRLRSGNLWIDNNGSEWQADGLRGLLFLPLTSLSPAASPEPFVHGPYSVISVSICQPPDGNLTFQNKAWLRRRVAVGGGGLVTEKQRAEWSEEKQKGTNEHVGSSQVVFSDDKVAFTCLLCCHLT